MSETNNHNITVPLYFIIGSPRSGTNMLHGFLDAHPETRIPTEFPFIPLYAPLFQHRKNWTERDVDDYLNWIQKKIKHPFWSIERWHIEVVSLRNRLLELIPAGLDYAAACRETIQQSRSVFPKTAPAALILKEPAYALQTKRLLQIFPDARFIYMYRDPRAQVNSVRHMPFGSRLCTVNSFFWNRVQKHVLKLKSTLPDRVLCVAYEDLVRNTENSLLNICAFLQLPFDEKMLHYHEFSDSIKSEYGLNDPDILQYGTSSFLAPDATFIDKWTKDLSKKDIRIIEAGCRRQMKKLQYEPMFHIRFSDRLRYVPVYLHMSLQAVIGKATLLLPLSWRLKILFLPSLFEATYGRLFGKSRKN